MFNRELLLHKACNDSISKLLYTEKIIGIQSEYNVVNTIRNFNSRGQRYVFGNSLPFGLRGSEGNRKIWKIIHRVFLVNNIIVMEAVCVRLIAHDKGVKIFPSDVDTKRSLNFSPAQYAPRRR